MKQLSQFGVTEDMHDVFGKIDQSLLLWTKQGYFTKGITCCFNQKNNNDVQVRNKLLQLLNWISPR